MITASGDSRMIENIQEKPKQKRTPGDTQHDRRIIVMQMMKIMRVMHEIEVCPDINPEFLELFSKAKGAKPPLWATESTGKFHIDSKRKVQSMSKKQQLSILGGLSSISKKVYAATPISESWNAQQIRAELMRNGSANIDIKAVSGCLDGLKKDGLVRESLQGGKFKRVAAKPTDSDDIRDVMSACYPDALMTSIGKTQSTQSAVSPKECSDTPKDEEVMGSISMADAMKNQQGTVVKVANRSAIDILAPLTGSLDRLSSDALALKQQLESASLEIEALLAELDLRSKKFSQLKALLGEL